MIVFFISVKRNVHIDKIKAMENTFFSFTKVNRKYKKRDQHSTTFNKMELKKMNEQDKGLIQNSDQQKLIPVEW